MYQLGIFSGLDLKSKSVDFLEEHFGKSGAFYYDVVRVVFTTAWYSQTALRSQ
jgi:DNA polymerase-4